MATFKKPKGFNPNLRSAPSPSKRDMYGADLGFSDDEEGSVDGTDSESEKENSDGEEGGISFLEFLTLQKTLRRVTEQKMELTQANKELKDRLRKSESAYGRAMQHSKTQVAILQSAQSAQMKDRDQLVDSLNLTIEELNEAKGNDPNANGIRQMVEQITSLSNEKRELFEKSEFAAQALKELQEEMESEKSRYEDRIVELKNDFTELRTKIDPIKLETQQTAEGGASSAEAKALRQENTDLKDRIEIMQAQNAAQNAAQSASSNSGISGVQAERQVKELKDKEQEVKELREQVKELRASVAAQKAMSASGGDKDKAAQAVHEQMAADLADANKKLRAAERELDETKEHLSQEKAISSRVQAEIKALKDNLQKESERLQSGADAAKSIESQLSSVTQDLASTKASLASEQSAVKSAKDDLAKSRAEVQKLKDDVSNSKTAHGDALAKEKERSASALQKAKAQSAADLAEAKQRAADETKDLRSRLGGFASIVQPMAAELKLLSKNYKQLKKQSVDLSSTIAPAVKQCKRDLLKTLAEVDKQYKDMLRKYRKEMALRKKLHNELVDLKGNIRVFCRVRPIIGEDGKGSDVKIVIKPNATDDQIVDVFNKGRDTNFEMDTVFGPESKQDEVFIACRDLITSVVDGFNVCIFAYGQTGSGKTFTMEGNDANPGLNRRALAELFNVVEEKKSDWSFELEVSVLEIYNENLRDLLSGSPKTKLDIKHGKAGPYVPGLSSQPVRNVEEVRERFEQAKSIRATSKTDMNDLSSRSHCLLIVTVMGTNLSTGVQTRGKLNLIDLAGSERVNKSGASEDAARFKEATSINKSLSSLGDVIHALGAKQKHIPYRNSKLTHLLQDSLGGHAKTLMVVQISPVLKNVSESVCSLNFAKRVRAVELGAAKKTTESAEISSLRKQIKELQSQL